MRIVAITEDTSLTVTLAMMDGLEVVSVADAAEAAEAAAVASMVLIGVGGTEAGLAVADDLAARGVALPALVVGDVPAPGSHAHIVQRPYTMDDLRRSIEDVIAGVPVAPPPRVEPEPEPEPAPEESAPSPWRSPEPSTMPPPAPAPERERGSAEPDAGEEARGAADASPEETEGEPPAPPAQPAPPAAEGEDVSDASVADTLALIDRPATIRIPRRGTPSPDPEPRPEPEPEPEREPEVEPEPHGELDPAPADAPAATADPAPAAASDAPAMPVEIESRSEPAFADEDPATGGAAGGLTRLIERPAIGVPREVADRMDEAVRAARVVASLLEDLPFLADPAGLVEHLLREAVETFGPETAVVYVEEEGSYRVAAAHGLSAVERAAKVRGDQALFGDVSLTLDPVLIEQVGLEQELIEGIAGVCTEAIMAAPIVREDRCEAIIVVGRDGLTATDLKKLATLAAEAAMGIGVAAELTAVLRRS